MKERRSALSDAKINGPAVPSSSLRFWGFPFECSTVPPIMKADRWGLETVLLGKPPVHFQDLLERGLP